MRAVLDARRVDAEGARQDGDVVSPRAQALDDVVRPQLVAADRVRRPEVTDHEEGEFLGGVATGGV